MLIPRSNQCYLLIEVSATNAFSEVLQGLSGRQQLRQVKSAIAASVQANHGLVVRTDGELTLSAFATPDSAIAAAMTISERFPTVDLDITAVPVAITQALACGTVSYVDGALESIAIDAVHRLMNLSRAGQILADPSITNRVKQPDEFSWRPIDPKDPDNGSLAVFGEVDEIPDFSRTERLVMQDGQLLTTREAKSSKPEANDQGQLRLTLRSGSQQHVYDLRDSAVTIGRAPDNALVIADPHVSRYHARIEQDEQGAVLVSLSGNGTCLQLDGADIEQRIEERRVLEGSGRIGLGPSFAIAEEHEVVFSFVLES